MTWCLVRLLTAPLLDPVALCGRLLRRDVAGLQLLSDVRESLKEEQGKLGDVMTSVLCCFRTLFPVRSDSCPFPQNDPWFKRESTVYDEGGNVGCCHLA